MERSVFNGLFKDLMTHIYDFAMLENHPLTQVIDIPKDLRTSRGNFIQEMILEEIRRFRPVGKEISLDTIEWRPYLILQKRYIEGVSLQDLAAYLAISKRQMRRDHSRALQALAGRLWDRVFREKLEQSSPTNEEGIGEGLPSFESNPEILDIAMVLAGVTNILQRHLEAEEIELELDVSKHLVLGDRIILRQILISLFNYAIHLQCNNHIKVKTSLQEAKVVVEFQVTVDRQWTSLADDENEDLLGTAKLWCARLNASLEDIHPAKDQAGMVRLIFAMPPATQATIMIVDDQQPTIRMYKRYLSRTNHKVIGVSDPNQVFDLAKQLKPDVILLDVMMPQIDGWEILQKLGQDEGTNQIPVIVCSAWETPDLARSLGAADFLKKPITQEGLLSAIQHIAID